jgi:hypothetical protein
VFEQALRYGVLSSGAPPRSFPETGDPAALIGKYLPHYDYREYRAVVVPASPGTAYAALRSLDLNRSRLVRFLFWIRTLPYRYRGGKPRPETGSSFLEEALSVGWKILEENPGREIVVGAVTQPWSAVVRFRGLPGPEFTRFAEPGFTRIAWSLSARPMRPGLTELVTETRVAATDPVARRKFRRYWLLVSPGIRLIRIVSLALVKRDLERRS